MTPARPPNDGTGPSRETPARCPRPMRWMEYLDGEIPAGSERRALRAHLAACANCRAEVESLRESDSALRAADPAGHGPMPVESFLDAVKRRAAEPDPDSAPAPRRRIALGVSIAAAVAAALLAIAALRPGERNPAVPAASPDDAATPLVAAAPETGPPASAAGAGVPGAAALHPSAAAVPLPPGLPLPEESAAFETALSSVRARLAAAAAAPDSAARTAELDAARAVLRVYPSLSPRLFEGLDRASSIAALDLVAASRDPLVVAAVARLADEARDNNADDEQDDGLIERVLAALASMRTERAVAALAAFAARPGDAGRAALRSLADAAASAGAGNPERESAALAALVRLARDRETSERAAAVAALAGIGLAASDRSLVAILELDHGDPDVLAAARSRRSALLPPLVASLDRARGEERARTLESIGSLADESLLPFLSRHANRGARHAAESASILGSIACDDAVDALLALRDDAAADVRAAAAAAIRRQGDAAVARAERALEGPHSLGALQALADVGSDAAIAVLASSLGRPGLAVAAAEALGSLEGDAATAALAAGASSGSAACRRELERRTGAGTVLALGDAARSKGVLTPGASLGRRREAPLAPPSVTGGAPPSGDARPDGGEKPARPSVVRRPGSGKNAPPPNVPEPERRPPRR